MEIRNVLQATKHRWRLLITVLVGALGCAALATALAVPQYATTVVFFVSTPSSGVSETYHGGLFAQERIRSYEFLLKGEVAGKVAQADGINLTPEQVRERITSQGVKDTVLLQAAVTDSDRARSERIATLLSREFISVVEKLETPRDQTTPAVSVEVIEGPTLDPAPVSPDPVRNFALATALGLLLGVVAALAREKLDTTVKSAETLRDLIAAPVLAVVPFDANARRPAPEGVAEHAVDGGGPHSMYGEAVRHLRTNLQFVDVDRPARVIMITSPVLGEGKSTTAVNLAVTFAEMGRRVALVEADLRRPRVADYLGLAPEVGLSNVIAGQVELPDALQRWGPHELHVLTSGATPPNPSELLGSQSMATLFGRLREGFDMVIVDTPPTLPFTDAAVVAATADGVVLVVRSGKTHRARVRAAATSLRAVNSRLLGSVLNMQASKTGEGYYYDGYQNRDGEVQPAQLPAARPAPGEADGDGHDVYSGLRR